MTTTNRARSIRSVLAALLVAGLAAALLLAVPGPALAASTYTNVDQLLVDDFVEAGDVMAQDFYDPEQVDAVVLATTANFPDGLTASAVAGQVGGPVLFTDPDSLPEATRSQIDRLLDPGDTVYVMGGTAAISDAVTAELEDYTVERLSGPTRLETAVDAADLVGIPESGTVLIARAFGPDGANTPSDRTTGWVDAISCGAFAALNQIPIYLTETDQLSDSTREALDGSGATTAVVCGGTAAVGDAVVNSLRDLGLTVDRVFGPTRVETAVAAAQELFGFVTAGGNSYTIINGYGENFGYGLAAAPLGRPILLVGFDEPTACDDDTQPSRQTLCYLLTGTGNNPADLLVVGDEGVIGDVVSNAVGEAAGGQDISDLPVLDAPADVDAVDDINDDGTRASVTWDAVADPDDIQAGYNVYVDGERVGPNPTVPEGTTYELTDLTPDEEVSVTVTAVDVADRESEMSGASTVTPTDEPPADATNFTASPGNARVFLSWGASPSQDLQDYQLQRAEATTCDGASFTDLSPVDADATTYTDDTATNDTSYCYKLIANDANNSTDGVVAGPAVPDELVAGLEYDGPNGTVSYPGPVEINWTLNPAEGDPDDYEITLAYSVNAGGTYFPIADPFQHPGSGPEGSFTWNMPRTEAEEYNDGDADRLDANVDGDFRIRIFAEAPDDAADSQTISPALDLTRAPRQVADVVAIPGDNQVRLVWDQNPEVDRLAGQPGEMQIFYQVFKDQVMPFSEDCPPIELGGYSQVNGAIGTDQTLPGDDSRVFVDLTNQSNGNDFNNPVFCYYVRAVRQVEGGTTFPGAPSSIVSADPEPEPGATVTILSPSDNTVVDQAPDTYTFRFNLTNPQDTDLGQLVAYYCADADVPPFGDELECESGEQQFGTRDLAAGEQEGEVSWTTTVPNTGQGTETGVTNPDQGEDQEGWIRVELKDTGGATVDNDMATGIRFR